MMIVEPTNTGMMSFLRNGLVEQALEFFLGQLFLPVEVLHHELVVGLRHKVAQLLASELCGLLVLGGNLLDALSARFVVVTRLHADDVYDALEVRTGTDGDVHGAQARAKAGVQRRHSRVEVGAFAVDVVDEHRTRKTHGLGLVPQARRHYLRTVDGVDDEQRHFRCGHGQKRIADEIRVPGSVEKIDLVVFEGDRARERFQA